MAKISEEKITIRISRIVKDTDKSEVLSSNDIITTIESVVQELAGKDVVVEVSRG